MEIKTIKALLDACYQAKRIRDLLPALPQGVTPSYIHYLDTIESLEQQGTRVKVSDISDALNLPRPGVTGQGLSLQANLSRGRAHHIHLRHSGRKTAVQTVQRTIF